MALRIDFSRSLPEELRRILIEQSERAVECLGGVGSPVAEDSAAAVHELRKATKKVRASLRMLSPIIERQQLRCQIERWRCIAAGVAAGRDLVVLEQLLKSAYAALAPGVDPSTRPWERLTLFCHFAAPCRHMICSIMPPEG